MKKVFSIIGSVIYFILALGFAIVYNVASAWIAFVISFGALFTYIFGVFLDKDMVEIGGLSFLGSIALYLFMMGLSYSSNFFLVGSYYFNTLITVVFFVLYFYSKKKNFATSLVTIVSCMPLGYALSILTLSRGGFSFVLTIFAILLAIAGIFTTISANKKFGPHLISLSISAGLAVIALIAVIVENDPEGYYAATYVVFILLGLMLLGSFIFMMKCRGFHNSNEKEAMVATTASVSAPIDKEEKLEEEDTCEKIDRLYAEMKRNEREVAKKEETINLTTEASLPKEEPTLVEPTIEEPTVVEEATIVEESIIEEPKVEVNNDDYLIKTKELDLSSSLDDFLYKDKKDDSLGNLSDYDPMDSLKNLGNDK